MPKRSYHRILDEHLHILITQGNHDAYQKLKRRYRYHSLTLCRDILSQYSKTGVTMQELITICDDCFMLVVARFDPELSSFFSFWKDMSKQMIMDYLIDNAYTAEAAGFSGTISIDQEFEDNHSFADYLCEKDEDRIKKKRVFEIKSIIAKHEEEFSKLELGLLNLVLDGYSIMDMEHSGVRSKSSLYLTFNNAVDKLQKILENSGSNIE